MKAEEVAELIGLEYNYKGLGSIDEGSFNCAGLLKHCRDTYFKKGFPAIPIGDEKACRTIFAGNMADGVWAQVESPRHGDGALMREGNKPHVGIYLDLDGGGILHALEGVGVVFTSVHYLARSGFGRTKYYRLDNDGPPSDSP